MLGSPIYLPKCTLTSLPKRDELSLRAVLALPKDSSTGLECSRICSIATWQVTSGESKVVEQGYLCSS